MAKYVTHYEVRADAIHVTVEIPRRRNGEHNDAALGRVLMAIEQLPSPSAFDPPDAKPEPAVVPHGVAQAAIRDGVRMVPASADSFDAAGDWIAEEIPGFRCANGACAGD